MKTKFPFQLLFFFVALILVITVAKFFLNVSNSSPSDIWITSSLNQKNVKEKSTGAYDATWGAAIIDQNLLVPKLILENEGVVEEFEMHVLMNKKENELTPIYTVLAENVETSLMQKTSIDAIFPNEWKERNIVVHIVDWETGEGVSGVSVSLRWGFLWTTDEQGTLMRSRKLPRTHDYLYFQASKIWYTQAFAKKALFFIDSSDIVVEMQMKKMSKNVVSIKKNPENDKVIVSTEELTMTFTNACWLKTSQGDCYEWDALLEYQFIEPSSLEYMSIPMRAVNDTTLWDLESNGMAFMNFYSTEGRLLEYDAGVAEVCYTIDQDQITHWKETSREGDKDGYRYFDKADGLRKYDESAKITISDGKFCVQTQHVY